MKIKLKGLIFTGVGLFVNISLFTSLFGGEPLLISTTGVPYKWDNSAPITFNPDGGGLGILNNTEAVGFTLDAFQAWADITTATISFTNAGQITDSLGTLIDVNVNNFMRIINKNTSTAQNEIVFDETGEIFELIFGPNSGILGFAGPDFTTDNPQFFITEGSAFINGGQVDGNPANGEVSLGDMKATIVHELGHFLNLAHTQVNGLAFFNGEDIQGFGPPPASSIETMYPIISDSTMMSPHADDIAVFSLLYPAVPTSIINGFYSNYSADMGTITGKVFFTDGITPANGVNVIARNTSGGASTIFDDAVSQISGAFAELDGFGSTDLDFQGRYTLNGLTPGANYAVEIDEIGPGGYSSATLIPLPGPEEFYNGANESSDPTIDNKFDIEFVTPVAGAVTSNIDVIFNDELIIDKYDNSIETILTLRTPNGPNDYFAVRHSIPVSLDIPVNLLSIRFFNNDDQTVWPQVIITKPNASNQPDLANPDTVFHDVSGSALGFINIITNIQLTNFDDIFVVIQLPPGESLTDVGAGGGPGVGTDSDLNLGFITGNLASNDGVTFNELDDYNLGVELNLFASKRPDALEPNDNMASASPIFYGSTRKAYIDPAGDLDYFSFTGSAGDFIQVDVEAITLGSTMDGFVSLLNSTGAVIAQNDDEIEEVNLDPLLEVVLPEAGSYFLVMDTYENNQNGMPVGGASLFYEFTLNKVFTAPRLTHRTGNVDFSVWSIGIYGDDSNGSGNGFSFMGSPKATLYSGGFVAATPTKVAGNVPSLLISETESWIDFEEVIPFTPFTSNSNFNNIGMCEFDEGNSNIFDTPIGLAVKQTSYSDTDDKFVLVECEVSNTLNFTTLSNLYLGHFGDWDIGIDNYERNRGGYDDMRALTYQYETGSNPNDPNYYGIKALQDASGARVTEALDEDSLYTFISNFNGPGPAPITTNDDYRSFIGSGPFTLTPGASVTVGFAWVAGTNLADIQSNADAAQAAWDLVVSVEEPSIAQVPIQFSLEQNYPNPFNPNTKIKYAVAENTQVSLIVYNMLGQAVRTLVDKQQSPDLYEVEWDGHNDTGIQLASGVYLYKLKSGKEVKVRKMLLLK